MADNTWSRASGSGTLNSRFFSFERKKDRPETFSTRTRALAALFGQSTCMHYISSFATSYERSYRSDGVKALRYFPSCKSTGHKTRAFCGEEIVAQDADISDGHKFVFCGQTRYKLKGLQYGPVAGWQGQQSAPNKSRCAEVVRTRSIFALNFQQFSHSRFCLCDSF